jgi:hypothetical protein
MLRVSIGLHVYGGTNNDLGLLQKIKREPGCQILARMMDRQWSPNSSISNYVSESHSSTN